jgi:S-adenosylmethionine decarboxylase
MAKSSTYKFSTHDHIDGSPGLYYPPLPEVGGHRTHGTIPGQLPGHHLIVECYGASHLRDLGRIEQGLREAAVQSRATIISMSFHSFGMDQGITGVAMLAESHMSVHTWPENNYCAIDIFMCGNCDPCDCLPAIVKLFGPQRLEIASLVRGRSAINTQAERVT